MTTRTQQLSARRWMLVFLAALVAVLATILSSATASAATTGGAETRVRASAGVVEVLVEPPQHIASRQRLGNGRPGVVLVVATGVAAKGADELGETAARSCSFAGATTVLMADGTRKLIEDIKVGDRVIATNPETGEQVAKTVEHVFVHDDTVTDLVVDGEVIATTEDHPFWSVTDQRFERADELEAGEYVLGAEGQVLTVSGMKLGTARPALAYNLTVEGIHTYHVGQNDALVHNTCPNIPGNPFRGADAPRDAFAHLKRHHGLDPTVASNRLHVIKRDAGLGAADDVVIGRTGDIYDARTGDLLDTLTNPGLGTKR